MLLSKYLNVNTLVAALALLSVVSIYTGFNIKAKYEASKVEVASSKYLYSIVAKEKHRLDSMVVFYKNSIKLRDDLISIKEEEIAKKNTEISKLRKDLASMVNEVSEVTAEESYNYINNRIPAIALKIYPFDSIQVKTIHKTFIERDGYFKISVGLDSLVKHLNLISFTKDNQISDLRSLNKLYNQEKDICYAEKEAYITENKGLKKDVKRQKNMKTVSNLGILGLAVVILTIIL